MAAPSRLPGLACSSCIQRCLLMLLVLPSLLVHPGSALRWVKFHVPNMVEQGDDVTLTCQFDLAGEKLYSVKWYKAGREFYRYVPAEHPTKQNFDQKGVIVDTDRSDAQSVSLKGITVDSTGRYKCEVLTEAPQFKTLVKSSALTVIELPEGRPEVTGGQHQYQPGDTVDLICRAPKSIPPANLTWFINEEQAPPKFLVHHRASKDLDGRAESRLGLRFKAQQLYFPEGRVRLRCVASIPTGEGHRSKPLYAAEVQHEGVVVPPDPLSLGHDANDALCLLSSGTGQMFLLMAAVVTCIMTGVLVLPNFSFS